MMPVLHTSSSSITTFSLSNPPVTPRRESQTIIQPHSTILQCHSTALEEIMWYKQGAPQKHQGGDPSGSVEIWTRNRSPVLPTPPKKHQKDKTSRRCSELLTALLQPPQPVQGTPACAYTPVAMGTCCSTESTLSLSFSTATHHQQAKRSITQTPPPSRVQPNECSIPHEGNCPHINSPSCSFTLQPPTQKYLPRSVLWPPPAWDKEVVSCTQPPLLHHCKDTAPCKQK